MTTAALDRFPVEVTDAQVAFFEEHGYLAVDCLTSTAEVESLGVVYDELYANQTGLPDGVFDLARPYGTKGDPLLGQLLLPERHYAGIRDTVLWRDARHVASRLLGVSEDELQSWGHLIAKAPHTTTVTPWHQDEAYWDPKLDYVAVGSWAPMDDATVENGCLWFLPGSHREPVRPHRHLRDDPSIHVLEVTEPIDCTDAVPVPVPAGGATFHHPRLLHFSGPNLTGQRRRAWANEFQTKPVRRREPAHRPWVAAGEQALAATVAARRSTDLERPGKGT